MKISTPVLTGGIFLLFAAQVFAQDSGMSHPETLNDTIVVAPPASVVIVTPASAANTPTLHTRAAQPTVQVVVPAESGPSEVYLPYQPYQPNQQPQHSASAVEVAALGADAGIVTTYPYAENALSAGTILRAHLVGTLSTDSTRAGSHFIATLAQNVEHNGRVILPVGASLEGRVTQISSGRRFSGGASIHLEPETVTLPDGTLYHLSARVVDLDSTQNAHVNDEGTIMGSDHNRGHAVTLGATTAGAALAGAAIGGGVGAAVGAGVGAGVGTVLWLKQDRGQSIPAGTELIFSLNSPMDLSPTAAAR